MGNDQCGAIEFVRGYQKRTEQELESFLAGELANLSVQRRLLYGDPANEIVQYAEQEEAGLIVLLDQPIRSLG